MKKNKYLSMLVCIVFIFLINPKCIIAQETSFVINDPFYYGQWYLENVKWRDAIKATKNDKKENVIIAVIDTGIKDKIEDLKGKVTTKKTFIEIDSEISNLKFSHGTFLASIISSKPNEFGIIGITNDYPIFLMDIKIGDKYGVKEDLIPAAIRYACNEGADVINLSFGDQYERPKMKSAIQYAASKNVIVVAAAGNNGSNMKIYPAAYNNENIISVGATDISNNLWQYSNYGEWVDVVAPGNGIIGLSGLDKYGFYDGTSLSAAIVSAQCAMVMSLNKKITANQVIGIIKQTAEKINSEDSKEVKYGQINLLDSLLQAKELT